MYCLTIETTVENKTMIETIRGGFWLTYHTMNTLYNIDTAILDKMFATIDNHVHSVSEFKQEKKKYILTEIEFIPEQSRKELSHIIFLLKTVIKDAENNPTIKLCTSFMIRVHNVIAKVNKSI